MSPSTKERRLAKAKTLMNWRKHPRAPSPLIVFSDEKNFSADPDDVPRIMATKFPSTIMVLEVVSNEDDVIPS